MTAMCETNQIQDRIALESSLHIKVSHIEVLARVLRQDLSEYADESFADQCAFASLLVDQVEDLKGLIQQAALRLR